MIRAVFDTNVVISGRLWSGAPRQAIQAAEQGRVKLLISEAMLDELRDVVRRPKFNERLSAIGKTAEQVISEYLLIAEVVEPATLPLIVEVDPDDDAVLVCAVGGKADYVVTGDGHLLALGTYQSIPILDVNRFLEQIPSE